MTAPVNHKIEIADRQREVSKRLLAGMHYRDIAADLGVGLGTVARDVQKLLAEWKDARLINTGEKIAIDERRLEQLIGKFMEVAIGKLDPRAAEVVIKALDRKASMLGLNAAAKTDVTSAGNALSPLLLTDLTDDERRNIIALAYTRLADGK